MKIKFLFILTSIILSSITSFSQNRKAHPKTKYIDSLNRYYQHPSLPVFLYISNSADENPVKLSKEEIRSKEDIKPIYLDGNGIHYIRHIDAIKRDHVDFAIYADGIPPVTKIEFLEATRFIKKGTPLYGPKLKIRITAKDNMSGVSKLYYSIDNNEFTDYSEDIIFDKAGEHSIQYYAVDNVGNPEDIHISKFIVDNASPASSHQVISLSTTNIISINATISLSTSDDYSGVSGLYYSIDGEKFKTYNKSISVKDLKEGEHTIKYYAIDNLNNIENENSYTFFLDKSSPIVASDVLGDKFIVNNQMYFSGRTKFKITAVDNKAGVKKVLYSIDNGPFLEYTEPFYLPSKSGLHAIKYYAIDNLGNEGVGNNNQKFGKYDHLASIIYVDLTGPKLRYQFNGPKFFKGDSTYISSETKISLFSDDPESGDQYIAYSVDGNPTEIKYTEPFSIDKPGKHKIDYFGYDNVNNRNVDDFVITIDNSSPEIFINFSVSNNSVKDGINVYPSYVQIFLASTDMQTGNSEMYYSINDGKEISYKTPIQGFEKEKLYKIKIRAADKLGNTIHKEIIFRTDSY